MLAPHALDGVWIGRYPGPGVMDPARILPDGCIDVIWDGTALVVAAPDADAAAGLLEAELARRASKAVAPDPAVPALARSLAGGRDVAATAALVGISERQLRRRCLAAVGYGPKTLQRVLRFRRALALARRGEPFADLALAAGYADQSHLANEVRALAGVPLGVLVPRQHFMAVAARPPPRDGESRPPQAPGDSRFSIMTVAARPPQWGL